jgi:carboxyl-terminal processing protease
MMKRSKIIIIGLVSVIAFSSYKAYRSDFFEIAKQIEIFTALYKEINMNYVDEVNPAELMDTAITKMLDDLDPYTNFYNEQDVEDARINRSANYAKLGLELRNASGKVVITDIIKDFAADKSGLKLADEIISIDGSPVENFESNLGEILSGAPNTSVAIQIKRNGQTKSIELKRSLSKPTAVPFFGMADDKTGFIVLSKFTTTASKDVALALLDLKDKGAEQIILDLRKNPGGLLSEAVNVCNIFLPKDQLIVYTKSKIDNYNQTYSTKKEPIDTEIPLVVLINENSASASEIVSGSLQDIDRAVVIGARSFGKGLVQRPKPLKYGTQVKITISRYFLPSGRGIQALEYQDGESIRKSIKDSKAFLTQNGRTVYDGGGIKPDVEVDAEQVSDFSKTLVNDLIIFDFATKYAQDNPNLDWQNFEVDNKVFSDFLEYIEYRDYDVETTTDKKMEDLIASAKNDHFNDKYLNSLKEVKAELKAQKKELYKTYKTQISAMISDNVIKHFAYNQGVYQHNIRKADVVKKALEVLSSDKNYSNILNPQ